MKYQTEVKHNLQHNKHKTGESKLFFLFLFKMVERKQLTVLMPCLSGVLTSTLLLLQLHGVLLMKAVQQQRHLKHLYNEAVLSRNAALSRYHRIRKR